ncbi:hypothetical protein HYG86_15435 [Alkalicella caledoniensis]|uniref:Zinc-ribbon domain-containing protein n=1 Tax=Alkalicella caledoniensis TaxID=2731377 RepID=A0A7G9WBJ8_ALKCA|nr:hypothetical protein [Alkalicella caledoniensis]QNO16060.1 hypothetical protein HYG86_15435 [Alkalicella caledoniensis]
MPILVCLAMAGILYFLLDGVIGDKDNTKTNTSDIAVSEPCAGCGKKVNNTWRYCPFCGYVKETGEKNE